MDIKFSKESQEADSSQDQPQEKGRQTSLLILLLVLLGGFAYLYFFTDLIRKQPGEQLPLPAPSVVKQPLPQRPVSSVVATVPSPATLPQAAVPAVPPTVAVVPAKPATAPAQQPAVIKPPVQPVVKPPANQPSAAQMAAKVGGDKPVASQQAQPIAQTKTTAVPVKTKLEQSKAGAAKAPVPAAAKQAAVKASKPVKTTVTAKPGGPWTLVVGLYVVEETLASDAAEVKKTGLNPLITTGPRREVTMNRLFLGEFSDKQQALQAIEKLRAAGGSGFTLQKGDKVEAYAGSFAVASGAQSERQRLAAAGVTTTVRKTTVSLASRKLTAGTYTNRSAADQAVKKLKSAGIGTPTLE